MGAGCKQGRGRGRGAAALLPLLLPLLLHLLGRACAQVAWTPIYVDGNNQVDLWTQEAQGCPCKFDPSREDCACCVQDGGCQCGKHMPNRCSQCGLEQHCGRMCNVTLDSRFLASRSGKTFGQIKSPSLEGPAFCWFLLQPDAGQRVEVQVYRLVSAGRFNGSSCEGGFLQLVSDPDLIPSSSDIQICGGNERFAPPVVLFSDSGTASLLFVINEKTHRSQFLAYFSFTSRSNSGDVAFRVRGGHHVKDTECDWMYQEYLCRTPGYCVFASPGYPGLYPPMRHCKYYIATSSIQTMVHINITSLLPYTHCRTHNIAIYQGSAPYNSSLLKTICGSRNTEVTYPGPELLVEFSSGPAVPPYDYNGFLAILEFIEPTTSTEPSTTPILKPTVPRVMSDVMKSREADQKTADVLPATNSPRITRVKCDQIFYGNVSRSGHFDTKNKPWSPTCTIKFVGRASDVVHLSLFSYQLRAPSCETVVEIFDGASVKVKPRHQLCSPLARFARDPGGRFLGQQTFISSENVLILILRRPATSLSLGEEFLNGAFLFHDEKMDGTLRPDTLCDVDYYGSSSLLRGHITNPGNHQLYWNLEGTFRCLQRFVPAVNQSILFTVTTLTGLFTDPNCHTVCGESGCHCVTKSSPISQMDHLSFITDEGKTISCICGEFQREWIPIGLRSWSPLRIAYSVANYSWMQGFQYTAEYSFITDGLCGYSVISELSGEINSGKVDSTSQDINYFYFQECVWLFDSKTERQLSIELITDENRSCVAWNMTIYKYDENTIDNFGDALHMFCPEDHKRKIALPWNLNVVILRLQSVTSAFPEYTIRWFSQTEFKNPGVAEPALASSGSKVNRLFAVTEIFLIAMLMCA